MADYDVTFDLNEGDNINATFGLSDTDFDCIFKIDAVQYEYDTLSGKPQINGVTLQGNKTSADLSLASAEDLQNEATTRANNDTLLQNDINTLTTNLNTEISNRIASDTTLSNEISQEASNREDADEELQEQITANHNNFANYRTSANQDIIDNNINNSITDINNKIPSQATSTNQLADKSFVNFSIATETANFVGTFNSLEELQAVENPTNNDYGFVKTTDSAGNTVYNRYKYVASSKTWLFEYSLNNSSFTASQWAAINSGVTSTIIANKAEKTDIKDGKLTIQANGTDIATFTANQSTDVIANIDIPSSATWGNITGTLSNQTDLQNALNAKQPTGDYATNTEVTNAIETHNTSITAHEDIREKIKDIELFKFINATINGTPTIQSGQVSNFTITNYLQFPFVVDVRNSSFEIDFCFTTGSNVTTQQNILDSKYGLALAIANGHGLMAMSSNGTNWDIGSTSGTYTISANTTYYAKVTWDKTTYTTALSTDGETYTTDMTLTSSLGLYPTTIYIGGGSSTGLGRTPNPFFGSINFNKCYLTVGGQLIWQGMDDAGLATRADVSLSNLDSIGTAKITYTAGTGIDITNNVISNTQTSAEWGNITGTLSNQTDLQNALNGKQATLTSGTNIKTINNESILGSGNIEVAADIDEYTADEVNTLWESL